MIDNYDSFTFNLVHYLESNSEVDVVVKKNDELEGVDLLSFDKVVISPGPGLPENAGKIKEVIAEYHEKLPILGICLGHQAIGEVFGAELKNLNQVVHGLSLDGFQREKDPIFNGIPETFKMGRYHSWVIDKDTLSNDFLITSEDNQGEIMSIRHKEYDLVGIQFHPESILTPNGFDIIQNWLKI